MDENNTQNSVDEQTVETPNDGGDAVDPVNTEIDDIAHSIVSDAMRKESGSDDEDDDDGAGAFGSDLDEPTVPDAYRGDRDASGEDDGSGSDSADGEDDTDDDAVDPATEIDRSDAIDALIESGMDMSEIRALSEEDLLKLGAEKLAEQGEQPEEAKPDEPEEEEPSVTDEELMTAISEELGEDFSKREKERIGKAITKALDAKRMPKFDVEPIRQEFSTAINEVKGMAGLVNLITNELEPLVTERSMRMLSEAYPQLEDAGNVEKVKKAAEKYTGRTDTLHDAFEMAAFALFGGEQARKMKAHAGKVSRTKKAGKPTKRTTVARDSNEDEVTSKAREIVQKARST